MKKYFCCCLFTFITLSSYTQNVFQKSFADSSHSIYASSEHSFAIIPTQDSCYMMSAEGQQTGGHYLIKINLMGDTIGTKFYNGFGGTIHSTTDGGYLHIGQGGAINQVSVIKSDSLGNVNWCKYISGPLNEIHGLWGKQTNDGGYIICGTVNNNGVYDFRMYLIKLDSLGNLSWNKIITHQNGEFGFSVDETLDGGFILVGRSDGFASIIKTDSAGNIIWKKGLAGASANHVIATPDGGYIVAGRVSSSDDAMLLKLDAFGNLVWCKKYGGTGSEVAFYVAQTSDAGFILVGSTNSFGMGNSDTYLIKTDSVGNLLWSKTFGATFNDVGFSVIQTPDSGYFVTGYLSKGNAKADLYLIKTDANGNSTGCNETNPPTVISAVITQLLNLSFTQASGCYVSNMICSTSSGINIYNVCLHKDE